MPNVWGSHANRPLPGQLSMFRVVRMVMVRTVRVVDIGVVRVIRVNRVVQVTRMVLFLIREVVWTLVDRVSMDLLTRRRRTVVLLLCLV